MKLLWSALALLLGGLVVVFSFDLYNQYKFSNNYYSAALHIHLPAGLILSAGLFIILAGIIGIISAIIDEH